MAFHHVTEVDDPRVAVFRELPKANRSEFADRFVVEGRWLVERLLASRFQVDSILVEESRLERLPQLEREIPILAVHAAVLDHIVGFQFHRGMLACGRRPPAIHITEIAPQAGCRALLLICADVCDPANLGGMLRCAAAFGVDGVLITGGCADPFSRRVLRVSMGSALELPIVVTTDLPRDLKTLQHEFGFELFAAVLAADAQPLASIERPPRLGLLFGNEGDGLSSEIINCCDHRLTIPMQPHTDSLNAAVASGIFLHYFTQVATADSRFADDAEDA